MDECGQTDSFQKAGQSDFFINLLLYSLLLLSSLEIRFFFSNCPLFDLQLSNEKSSLIFMKLVRILLEIRPFYMDWMHSVKHGDLFIYTLLTTMFNLTHEHFCARKSQINSIDFFFFFSTKFNESKLQEFFFQNKNPNKGKRTKTKRNTAVAAAAAASHFFLILLRRRTTQMK